MARKKKDNTPEPSPNQNVNPPHEMDKIAAEGAAILEKEPIKNPIPEPVKSVVVDEKNPYLRAKLALYAKMSQWRRVETDRMINNKEYDNRHYQQFCKDLNSMAEYIIYDDLEKEAKKTLTSSKK